VKFKKEFLLEILWGAEGIGAKEVRNEIVDTRRWSIDHYLVFSYKDKFWGVSYSTGATECQDEAPFEYDEDEIECVELVPEEKTVIEYVPVKEKK